MHNILSQINFGKLFQPSYIFQVTPPAEGWYIYLGIIAGLLVVLAIGSIFWLKRQNKIYRKAQKRFFYVSLFGGISGLLLIFFRYEQIPYLSSRLLMWLVALSFIFLSGWIVFYLIFKLPKEKLEQQKKQKFIKYLPRKAMKGNT